MSERPGKQAHVENESEIHFQHYYESYRSLEFSCAKMTPGDWENSGELTVTAAT